MKTKQTSRTVAYCVKNNLCTGCGLCHDVCPRNAITIKRIKHLNAPFVDKSRCGGREGCSRCFGVCSGRGMELKSRADALYGAASREGREQDADIGWYRACYTGNATDEDLRFHAASGGCVTALLLYLLEKGVIGGAVVTRFREDDPFRAEAFLASTAAEIHGAKSSKYCPVSMEGMAEAVRRAGFPVAVVGLPCHIQAFRKLAASDAALREKIFLYIGLFCSGTKDYRAARYLCRKAGIDMKKVKRFAYRDEGYEGYEGYLTAEYFDGTRIKTPFLPVYLTLHSFFRPERCASCVDHFGMLADVSFGDICIPPYSDDKIGTNSVICRSEAAAGLLREMEAAGRLSLREIPASEVIRSQKCLSWRKHIFMGRRFLDRALGRPLVEYDFTPPYPLSPRAVGIDVFYRLQRLFAKTGLVCPW